MKKILAIILFCTLFIINLSASDVQEQPEMTKQEMMRGTEVVSEPVVDMEEPTSNPIRTIIAVILAVAIIMIVVGLLSTFITKYALSMRNQDEPIYKPENNQKNLENEE